MITGRVLFRKTADSIEKYAPQIRARLRRNMEGFLIELEGYVKEKKLTGQVLHVVTGTLRRSIHHFLRETEEAIIGSVASGREAPYAAPHEFGGTFVIPSHRRTITQAFGRQLKTPSTFTVRQHMAIFPERSFMRTSVRERQGPFREMTLVSVREGIRAGASA